MTRRTDRGDRGSLTVELVLLTPALFLIVLTIVTFGRISQARQQVAEAASAGAEAAAVSSTASGAVTGAQLDADAALGAHAHTCRQPRIETDTGHFYPGGFVTVTVTCRVALSDLAVPGLPGATDISTSSTAPIDPYRAVG